MPHPSTPPSTVLATPDDWIISGFLQAVAGLILGGGAILLLVGTDPFSVLSFTEPQDGDVAQRFIAFHEWKSSPRVILGQAVTDWIPLLVAGMVGLLGARALSIALRRMIGVTFVLLLLLSIGSEVLDRLLSSGESSDIRTPMVILCFQAFCLLLATTLTALVVPRRLPRSIPDSTRRIFPQEAE